MAASASTSSLKSTVAQFDEMLNKFGVVTVMDAKVYNYIEQSEPKKVDQYIAQYNSGELCTLDTLKIANINIEGPDKTITGGRFNDVLVKFGKKGRIEMQDALGNAKALEVFGGAVLETFTNAYDGSNKNVLHLTENFTGPKTIIGDSFFIDQKTGTQVPVKIILYKVMPDSIFNLSQDSEGNATVFDMNADLGSERILVGTDGNSSGDVEIGAFYSVYAG